MEESIMSFCPKCKYEYRPEISVCPDCGERLVSALPLEPEPTQEKQYDWTPVANITSPQYGQMILEILHGKDIPAILTDSSGHFSKIGAVGMSSFQPVAGVGTTLLVAKEFVEDAAHEAQIILGEEWEHVKLVP
jgi:hypothetical protein